jgi:type IV pilus assembly protein PilA
MLKPQLQAKFLQHLNNRKNKSEEGFTLIELLVVIIIIGILAAIALPSLLGQVNKAKQAEAKNYTGVANRSQQAYFLEYSAFASTLSQLQVGIKTQTTNYNYTIVGGGAASTTSGNYSEFVGQAQGSPSTLKSYYGEVGTQVGNDATSEALTIAIACESNTPNTTVPLTESSATGCDSNFASLAR